MKRIDVGDPAPDLSMFTHTGEQLSLADYRGEHPVVVLFYPKDGTAVCTKEACSFRDAYEDFTEAGAVVIGISRDSAARHQSFAEKHGLPFTTFAWSRKCGFPVVPGRNSMFPKTKAARASGRRPRSIRSG